MRTALVIAGDKDTKYQVVMQVWNAVKVAGIRNISFQVDSGGGDDKPKEKAPDKK